MKVRKNIVCIIIFLLMVSYFFSNSIIQASAEQTMDSKDYIIPVMTGASSPSPYSIESSDNFLWDAWYAFGEQPSYQGYPLSEWQGASAWIIIDLGSIQNLDGKLGYLIQSRNDDSRYAPQKWKVMISADKSSWETVDTVENEIDWEKGEERLFNFELSNTDTRYIKFDFAGTSAGTTLTGGDIQKIRIFSTETQSSILDIEPEKEKIKVNEKVTTDLVIDNISEIAAEDIRIKYDDEKLEFLGFEEVDGMKLVKSIEDTGNGELRVIVASKGEANIVDDKEILLKLEFKGISTGEALVDITRGRVTDGIEMEKDLTDEECGEGTIIVEAMADVNNSGEFTLLDLGIDARHFSKDPESPELEDYNTDIVVNGEIDEDDLLEIAKYILENPNYEPNN